MDSEPHQTDSAAIGDYRHKVSGGVFRFVGALDSETARFLHIEQGTIDLPGITDATTVNYTNEVHAWADMERIS